MTIVIFAVIGLVVAGFAGYYAWSTKRAFLLLCSALFIITAAALCFAVAWWQLNTESGKRAFKSQQSNLECGITRTVTVYDMQGDEIASYTGKFDVAHTDDRIMFDDETGNRHIVYFTTGTITVDELP